MKNKTALCLLLCAAVLLSLASCAADSPYEVVNNYTLTELGAAPAATTVTAASESTGSFITTSAPESSASAVLTTAPDNMTVSENAEGTEENIAEEKTYSPKFKLIADDVWEIDTARTLWTVVLDSLVSGEPARNIPERYMINGVKLDSWDVRQEEITENMPLRYEAVITLDVAESENEYIPVGVNDYVFIFRPDEGRSFLPLRLLGEQISDGRLLPEYSGERLYLNFCNDFTTFFSGAFEGESVTDFSSPDLSAASDSFAFFAICIALRYTRLDYDDLSYASVDEALLSLYGFSADAINLKASQYYNEETDTVELPGRGGSWSYGYAAEDVYNVEDSTRVVTIDYFEDDYFLSKSQTYRYTVRVNEDESFTMLKMERLFTSEKEILSGSV